MPYEAMSGGKPRAPWGTGFALVGVAFPVCPTCGHAAEWWTGGLEPAARWDKRTAKPVRCACGWTGLLPEAIPYNPGGSDDAQ